MKIANVEINVIKNNITYNDVAMYVDAIVENAFDKNGNYHDYLFDYTYTSKLLGAFTDYSGDYNFNEVMEICHSDEWNSALREFYPWDEVVWKYAKEEIDDRRNPLFFINKFGASAIKLIEKLDSAVDKIDVDKVLTFIDKLDVDSVNKFSKLLGGE